MTATHLELIEGTKTQRDKFISKVEVLERVKKIAFLPYEETMTTEMVANFYEVEIKTIQKLVERNLEELQEDGYKITTGTQLADIKSLCQIKSRARSLAIFPRQSVLRVGMLLRDSQVAIQVRNYLLDIESKVSDELKLEVIESYFDKLENTMNTKNKELIKVIQNDNLYIIEKIDNNEAENVKSRKELNDSINGLSERLSLLENSLIFKQYTKPSGRFDSAISKYAIHFNYGNSQRFFKFYNDFENWLNITLPRKQKYTTKEYILATYDIEIVEMFVDGVITGRIVKNTNNHFII